MSNSRPLTTLSSRFAGRRSSSGTFSRADRAVAPLAGVLLVALTVTLALVVSGAFFLTAGTVNANEDTPDRVSLSLAVDGETLALTHEAGDAIDVRRLSLVVIVDGEPLTHQPPVPFFAERGFRPGPRGPFNRRSDPTWTAGETATLTLAATNDPLLSEANAVSVELYVEDRLLAEVSARTG